MKKLIETVLQTGKSILLDQEALNELGIQEGEKINIEYKTAPLSHACISVSPNDTENEVEEGYFCIPDKIFKRIGLDESDVHVLINDEEIIITSTSNVISALPPEVIDALIEQNIDFSELAKDIVERLNDNVLEEIEG